MQKGGWGVSKRGQLKEKEQLGLITVTIEGVCPSLCSVNFCRYGQLDLPVESRRLDFNLDLVVSNCAVIVLAACLMD